MRSALPAAYVNTAPGQQREAAPLDNATRALLVLALKASVPSRWLYWSLCHFKHHARCCAFVDAGVRASMGGWPPVSAAVFAVKVWRFDHRACKCSCLFSMPHAYRLGYNRCWPLLTKTWPQEWQSHARVMKRHQSGAPLGGALPAGFKCREKRIVHVALVDPGSNAAQTGTKMASLLTAVRLASCSCQSSS